MTDANIKSTGKGSYKIVCALLKMDDPKFKVEFGNPDSTHSRINSLSFTESIFRPLITGSIDIADEDALFERVKFNGRELIELTITSGIDLKTNTKAEPLRFYISNVSNRVRVRTGVYAYSLTIVSPVYLLEKVNMVSKTFRKDMVAGIKFVATEFLGIPANHIMVGKTSNSDHWMISNFWTPLKCIHHMVRHLKDSDGFPGFFFFEDRHGIYHIASLLAMMKQQENIGRLVVDAQNSIEKLDNDVLSKVLDITFSGAEGTFSMDNRFNNGYYGGVEIGYDANIGTYSNIHTDILPEIKPMNDRFTPDANEQQFTSTTKRSFIPRMYNNIVDSTDNSDLDIKTKRFQLTERIRTSEVFVKVYASERYNLGNKINLDMPTARQPNEIKKENARDKILDKMTSGTYLIISITHHIDTDGQYYNTLQLDKDSFID